VPPCLPPGPIATRAMVGTVLTIPITLTYVGSTRAVSLDALQGTTVSGADLSTCLRLPAGARYLIVPQSAATGDGSTKIDFQLSTASPAAFVPLSYPVESLGRAPFAFAPAPITVQQQLDAFLRQREGELARETRGTRPQPAAAAATAPPAPALGSQRTFRVLSALTGSSFKTVTARLRYVGPHILIYVDVDQPSGAYSDAELAVLGKLFDDTMYEIDIRTFGAESDIDHNGRVDVLLTPAVNALTTASDCRTIGFVTGFFFGLDLLTGVANSNSAEVFYSLVPDPDATRSCAHSKDQVSRIIPATFIHEFQHMISFGQHVLARDGNVEVLWLNEGMSHIAEELGGRYYEDKFPPPSGRTDPAQLFPDSAQGFTVPDLQNAQRFLTNSSQSSVVATAGTASLEERGAAWLFLRWLGDHVGEDVYGRLAQTGITGVQNIEAQTGEPFPSLFGDFSTALYTDSLPGVARGQIPERLRFVRRNLRQIFKRFADTDTSHQTPVFPIPDKALVPGTPITGQIALGSMDFYVLDTRNLTADLTLRFTRVDQSPFAATSLAQLGIFRLP
jgi:hypothetical protein